MHTSEQRSRSVRAAAGGTAAGEVVVSGVFPSEQVQGPVHPVPGEVLLVMRMEGTWGGKHASRVTLCKFIFLYTA